MLCHKFGLHKSYHFSRKIFQTITAVVDKTEELILECVNFVLYWFWINFSGILEIEEELLYCYKLIFILILSFL
jgi:hypothetical protein